METAFFVDLSNFYNRLMKSGIGESRDVRDYATQWLDFGRMATFLEAVDSPIWIFYSHRRIGGGSERLSGPPLFTFIDRLNQQRGVTAIDVDIPGEQRESITVECPACGGPTQIQHDSEKGVDASLIVHLFDTSGSWDHAIILSGDADFTPAVRSLRRQGKRVSGAGFAGASPALRRETFEYINLVDAFLSIDFELFRLLGPGGLVEYWLEADIDPPPDAERRKEIVFLINWMPLTLAGGILLNFSSADYPCSKRLLQMNARSKGMCKPKVYQPHQWVISATAWEGMKAVLDGLVERYPGAASGDSGNLASKFEFDAASSTWRRTILIR